MSGPQSPTFECSHRLAFVREQPQLSFAPLHLQMYSLEHLRQHRLRQYSLQMRQNTPMPLDFQADQGFFDFMFAHCEL